MQLLIFLVVVLLALILITAIKSFVMDWFQRVTVFEFQRGLLYKRGNFAGLLGPGVYWVFTSNSSITCVDIRSKIQSVSGQEVLSSDGVTVKVSLAIRFLVEKPVEAIHRVEDFQTAIYQLIQDALREIVGTTPVDDLLAGRSEIGNRLLGMVTGPAAEFGLKMESVTVKDLMFPGELKKIFAQVVQARKEGQAALEKARGETAALRSLANAARMMESHPALLQLRFLQHLGESSGNTLVMGVPPTDQAVLKTIRKKAGAPAKPPSPPPTSGLPDQD